MFTGISKKMCISKSCILKRKLVQTSQKVGPKFKSTLSIGSTFLDVAQNEVNSSLHMCHVVHIHTIYGANNTCVSICNFLLEFVHISSEINELNYPYFSLCTAV